MKQNIHVFINANEYHFAWKKMCYIMVAIHGSKELDKQIISLNIFFLYNWFPTYETKFHIPYTITWFSLFISCV